MCLQYMQILTTWKGDQCLVLNDFCTSCVKKSFWSEVIRITPCFLIMMCVINTEKYYRVLGYKIAINFCRFQTFMVDGKRYKAAKPVHFVQNCFQVDQSNSKMQNTKILSHRHMLLITEIKFVRRENASILILWFVGSAGRSRSSNNVVDFVLCLFLNFRMMAQV